MSPEGALLGLLEFESLDEDELLEALPLFELALLLELFLAVSELEDVAARRASFSDLALLDSNLPNVAGPARPSTVRPLAFWKYSTALTVRAP